MSDILARILNRKADEVAERRTRTPLAELRARAADAPPSRGFARSLETRVNAGHAAVIAECKRASPSKGLLRPDYDPAAIAASYAAGGAAALSVLTDIDHFQGADAHLIAARNACALPAIRKDFVIDAWQLAEARVLGADAVLLIAAALPDQRLADFAALAAELGLDVLLEVHDGEELQRALATPARLIGINNRSLHTFETRLDTTLSLKDAVPSDRLLVTESGIHSRADVATMRAAGVHAFLVGEAFMRAPDPGAKLAELFA
ncbi:MAG: indole-3-glycerol phosphate synthase TrpC [Xanthomonadales bacterium]|jgi:indole-3-glycerol phosphate synthase|nr:indole-3-glycerol phosphate synthase TrpC [Xanthomonadales bacterium]